jgi:alkanesulfonate monooxygenase SsuD/methylene tetrahydromethanopterin reductase-like flavin-dependent oxidoreductase (luciferase family)
MTGLVMMFDLRRPEFARASRAEIYATTLEMCAWADARDWDIAYFNEHHGADDGYLPAPLMMCAAAAALTESIEIQAVLVAPFYDPIRLAEDLAVLDHVSRGRMIPIIAGGYRPQEYEMFGLHPKDRGARVEEAVSVLRRAWTGEPFQYRGRTVQVTPRPFRPSGPPLVLGARTKAGARRAARHGDSMVARVHWDVYREERVRLGKPDPGPEPRLEPLYLHVTEDPEKSRHDVGHHVMHWNNSYNGWFRESYGIQWGPPLEEPGDLANYPDTYCFLMPEEAIELARSLDRPDDLLVFRPLCGALDAEHGWASLELFAAKVQPHIELTHPRTSIAAG